MKDTLHPALFLLAAVLCIPAAITMWLLYKRLAEKHTETWRRLGSPTLLFHQSHASNMNVRSFVWSAEPRALGDRVLERYVLIIKALTVVLGLVFLAAVVTAVAWRA